MKKWVVTPLSILIGAVLIFVALLPTLLSTERGKNFIIDRVEKKTEGKLTIQSLSLSWFRGQEIEKFQFIEKEGGESSFDSLKSNCSFWNLLFRSGSIGNTHIINPKLSIPAKVTVKEKREEKFWSNFSGQLTISNGLMRVLDGGNSIFSMEDMKVDFKLDGTNSLFIQGKTRSNQKRGTIFVDGKKNRFFEGNAKLENVPVGGLDKLVAIIYPKMQGLLLATFGDTLTAFLSAVPGPNDVTIGINIHSPRFNADLKAQYINGRFDLLETGRMALNIKPFLFNHFIKDVALQNDAKLDLYLKNASLPFSGKRFDFKKFAGNGNLLFSNGSLAFKNTKKDLFVDHMSMNFNTQNLGELVDLNLKSTMQYAKMGESSIAGPLSIQNIFKKPSFPSLDLSFVNFPLALIDKNGLVAYLGEIFSGKIAKSKDQISLSGTTPLLNLQKTSLDISDVARLTAPASFTYLVTPKVYKDLARSFTVQGTLNSLTIPLDKTGLLFQKAHYDVNITSEQIELTNLFALGQATLPSLRGNLNGSSLETVNFDGNLAVNYVQGSWGQSILGENVAIKTMGKAKFGKEFKISPFDISLDGRKFKGDIIAAIEKNTLILKKGLQVDFLLEPEQINPILSKDGGYPLLKEATPLSLEIKPSTIPLNKNAVSSLVIKGIGKIDSLSLINPTTNYPFEIKDANLSFDLDGKKKSHNIHFEGSALEKGKIELALSGKKEVKELISSPDSLRVSLNDFSSQIADSFFKTRGQLPGLIGPFLDLDYQMEKMGENENIDFELNSSELTLQGAFVAGDRIELRSNRNPLKIKWNLSETSYDAFRKWQSPDAPLSSKKELFAIDGTGKLNIEISPFSISRKDVFNLYESLFDASAQIADLNLKSGQTGEITNLEKFNFEISKNQMGDRPLSFKFDGNVAPFGKGKSGSVEGEGNIKDFLLEKGGFDFKDVTTSIHAQIKNMPSVFVDALSKLDQSSDFPPSAFLGDLFNATFDAEVKKSQGKITMNVDASACRARFEGMVSDGILYLHRPLEALFTVTPQLNDILEKSARLVVVSIEKPITLFIHDEGFNVPLNNLHIRNTSFKYGQLDLGQILCKNVGSTSEVGGLFKMEPRGNVSIWFAPSVFNMNRGKMYVDRTEILYNRQYQVCLWGNILFPRRYVDMTLGLTAQALSSLGIGGIDDNYVLKVPVEGPFGNVEIDTGAASGKIAFLLARKHVAPRLGVWGQVLGAVGSLADDQSDVPPPKPPFPWQERR